MRILYVAPYLPSLLRIRPLNFIRQIVVRGHEVEALVLGARPADGEASQQLEALGVRFRIVSQPRAAVAFSCSKALLDGLPLEVAYCRSEKFGHALTQLLTSGRFDVLHLEHVRAAQYGLAQRTVPRVYDAVDCMTLLYERLALNAPGWRGKLAAMESNRMRSYERRAAAGFERVLISSEADRVALRAIAPDARLTTVRNGVDSSYFGAFPWEPEADTLIFTGIVRYPANAEAIVRFVRDVLPLVRRRRPGTKLLIVGSSPTRKVRSLGQLPGVAVTGYVADLRLFLSRAAVSICPISIGAGIQNKVLEAMAAGVPVVCSSLASTPLGLVDQRDVLVADDPEATARSVCRLLEDRQLARRLHATGRELVRRDYDWSSSGDRLVSIYGDAISQFHELRAAASHVDVHRSGAGGCGAAR